MGYLASCFTLFIIYPGLTINPVYSIHTVHYIAKLWVNVLICIFAVSVSLIGREQCTPNLNKGSNGVWLCVLILPTVPFTFFLNRLFGL